VLDRTKYAVRTKAQKVMLKAIGAVETDEREVKR
jgi:hypothetical protein